VGTAWVNQHGRVDPTIPFAGRKESALGVTYGRLGLEEFMSPFVLNVKV
jgi:acyl-CoA reductase-like NAD-dependent aldehyde dehydrogenase